MAYTRDTDRHTRGAGAIAAIDGSAARRRQRIQIGRATRARDRVMSRVARGALGRVNVAAESAEGETYAPIYTAPNPYTAPPAATPPSMWLPPAVIAPSATAPPSSLPPPTKMPPTPLPPPVMSPPFVAPGTGTVGVTMGLPPSTVTISPLPPGLPSEPDPAVADDRMRNMLLIGGAALVAYLLFREGV